MRGTRPAARSSETPHASKRRSPGAPRYSSSPSEKKLARASGSCSSSHSKACARQGSRPASRHAAATAASPARQGRHARPTGLDRGGDRVAVGVGQVARVGEHRGNREAPALHGVDDRRRLRQGVAGEAVEREAARGPARGRGASPARATAPRGPRPPRAAPRARRRSRGAARGPRRRAPGPRGPRGAPRRRGRRAPPRARRRTGHASSAPRSGTRAGPPPGPRRPVAPGPAPAARTPRGRGRPGTTGPPTRRRERLAPVHPVAGHRAQDRRLRLPRRQRAVDRAAELGQEHPLDPGREGPSAPVALPRHLAERPHQALGRREVERARETGTVDDAQRSLQPPVDPKRLLPARHRPRPARGAHRRRKERRVARAHALEREQHGARLAEAPHRRQNVRQRVLPRLAEDPLGEDQLLEAPPARRRGARPDPLRQPGGPGRGRRAHPRRPLRAPASPSPPRRPLPRRRAPPGARASPSLPTRTSRSSRAVSASGRAKAPPSGCHQATSRSKTAASESRAPTRAGPAGRYSPSAKRWRGGSRRATES